MIIIMGTIELVSAEELDRVRHALIARAARSRNHEGNIEYAFAQDLEQPNVVKLVEKWTSREALEAHLKIPDEDFAQVLTSAKLRSARIVSYEAEGGNTLMSR